MNYGTGLLSDLTLKAPKTNPVTNSTNGGVITDYKVVKTAGGEKKISGKVYLVVLSAEICETFKVDDDVVIGVSKGESENPKTKLMAEAVGADDWTATIKLMPDDKSVEILEPTELSKSSNLTNIRITKGYEFEKKEPKKLELTFKIKGKEVKVVKNLDLLPLEVKQENYPTAGGANDATDLETGYNEQVIGSDQIAYITGQPAVPELRVQIAGAPAALQVEWRLEIRTERQNLRRALDDRTIPAEGWITLADNQEWDITDALGDELIGGRCTLHYRINGDTTGTIPFLIRGKNPLDADALAHINGNVGANFQAYAWAMAKHESRQANQVYNQFNTQGGIEGTLNFGGPNGWGIAQIDRPIDVAGVTTAEVWNWHQNITAMNAKLLEKQAVYRRFIGYFRTAYGNRANWSEPPANHQIGNATLPAEAWGVMVLYNGAGGVPATVLSGRRFQSPWVFNPNNGQWSLHDNLNDYATTRVRPELEGTINSAE